MFRVKKFDNYTGFFTYEKNLEYIRNLANSSDSDLADSIPFDIPGLMTLLTSEPVEYIPAADLPYVVYSVEPSGDMQKLCSFATIGQANTYAQEVKRNHTTVAVVSEKPVKKKPVKQVKQNPFEGDIFDED